MPRVDQPLVSILTPTWNRGSYLRRVWDGLNSQTYENIEWIVADDGSSDGTLQIVRQLAVRSRFPVTLIVASVRIGKARMDNESIARARGEFILWNDSDDYLLPEAVEGLVAGWNSIPEDRVDEFVGVIALCASEKGVISLGLPKVGQFDTTWNDLSERYRVAGDFLHFTKTSALRQWSFPEVDFVIPEGVVWTALGNMQIRVLPRILEIKEYRASNCISFSGKMEYSRGRAYAMATSERNLWRFRQNWNIRWWGLITYIRLCVHGEFRMGEAVRLWGENSPLFIFLLMLPIGHILALRDHMLGKVHKTHREFLAASKQVVISCARLNFH